MRGMSQQHEKNETTHALLKTRDSSLTIARLPQALGVQSGYKTGIYVKNPVTQADHEQKLKAKPVPELTLLYVNLKGSERKALGITEEQWENQMNGEAGQQPEERSFVAEITRHCVDAIHAQTNESPDAALPHIQRALWNLARVQVVTSFESTDDVFAVKPETQLIAQQEVLLLCVNAAVHIVLEKEFLAGNAGHWGFSDEVAEEAQINPMGVLNHQHRIVGGIVMSSFDLMNGSEARSVLG